MKVKTLRSKKNGEFIHLLLINNKNNVGTCEIPAILSIDSDIEGLKKYYGDVDFSDIELVTLNIYDDNVLNADIRNKLSPINNLIALLENNYLFDKFPWWIKKEMNNVKKSIEYLIKL